MNIKVKMLPGGRIPEYRTRGAAGADLFAHISEPVVIQPGERVLIGTGVHLMLPRGTEGQVRPRSGLAYRNGITVLNSPGTIDSDYRGEVQIILINLGSKPHTVNNHDRIAQLVIAPVTVCRFTSEQVIDATERGAGGFGSTGV